MSATTVSCMLTQRKRGGWKHGTGGNDILSGSYSFWIPSGRQEKEDRICLRSYQEGLFYQAYI